MWWHLLDDVRLGVVLHREGEGTVILRAWSRLHTIRDFLLYHDSDRLDRCMALEEAHDDRGRDVVRKIRDDLHRISVVIGRDDLVEIELQYIIVDDGDIVIGL